jgi:hypothetical protein
MSFSVYPHMTFAKVADGINIYIFFLWMIHQDKHSGHRVALIPLDLQKCFWDKVVLPALKKHLDVASLPYMHFTVEEHQRKTTGKSQPKGADHYSGTSKAVDPSVLEKMIATIWEIIKDNYPGDILHQFRSFFFVLEAKGIKLYTQDSLRTGGDLWETLIPQFPHLDFEYMMDPAHGQLVVYLSTQVLTPSLWWGC